jgi:AsmA-like protein
MTSKRKVWIAILSVAVGVVVTFTAVVLYRWQMPHVRAWLIQTLSEQLDSNVELGEITIALGPIVQVRVNNIVIRHRLYPDAPPLVRADAFTMEASLLAILRKPVRISSIEVTKLHIFLPPRRKDDAGKDAAASMSAKLGGRSPVIVSRITTDDTLLEIGTSKPGRDPRQFEIRKLTLTEAAFDRPTAYDAVLTNPIPKGLIESRGTFGPWLADEPTLTALQGSYNFKADLGSIKGLGGHLDSTGAFTGRLEQIHASGKATVPDFSLDIGGQALPLTTDYVAIVDGTNGDTVLDSVKATLARTPLTARGGIVHMPNQKGRTVELDVTVDKGRLDDMLRLAIKGEPDMTGRLSLKSHLELPPGEVDVPIRLKLKGSFHVAGAQFTSDTVQSKIDELSRRARGKPSDTTIENVVSDLNGTFTLGNGLMHLSEIGFAVRGAVIKLQGTYALRHQTLDFAGTARMEAHASQMVTGWKRIPLKVLDPVLSKDGAGTLLPIRITGPVSKPEFKVEMGKIF